MEQMDPHPAPARRSVLVMGIAQLVFVVAVIAAAIGLSNALKGQVNDRAPQIADLRGNAAISVRIADVDTVRYTPRVRVNGTIQATAEVSVSPQVSGEIRFVSDAFRPGSEVKQGDRLFHIDRADYLLAVERAEADIAAAQSDLQQLQAEAAIAVQEWEELYPGREVNELAARLPQIEAAKARLSSAVANKRTAELSLQRTKVLAPMDARVLASNLDVGQIVSPGQVVGRLVALDSIELAVPVSSDQLAALEPAIGRSASYSRRGMEGASQSAQIVRVDASLDARTRLSNLYLVPEAAQDLRIGDFVDVTIQSEPVDGALRIPATALSGQSEVWVVQNDKLSARRVRILGEDAEAGIVFTTSFDIADGVVALPPLEAEEGQSVTMRQSPSFSATAGGRSDGAQ